MAERPVLVAIDMQAVFEPGSPWGAPRYAEASAGIQRLLPAFGGDVVLTRFVAPARPAGAWIPYYEQWPFALVSDDDPLYALSAPFADAGHRVETRTTFGKWDAGLAAAIGGTELVLAGVSTDCCVISTALAAADAGVHVRVAADACAGASDEDHARALAAMALYAPLIEITTVDEVLASLH